MLSSKKFSNALILVLLPQVVFLVPIIALMTMLHSVQGELQGLFWNRIVVRKAGVLARDCETASSILLLSGTRGGRKYQTSLERLEQKINTENTRIQKHRANTKEQKKQLDALKTAATSGINQIKAAKLTLSQEPINFVRVLQQSRDVKSASRLILDEGTQIANGDLEKSLEPTNLTNLKLSTVVGIPAAYLLACLLLFLYARGTAIYSKSDGSLVQTSTMKVFLAGFLPAFIPVVALGFLTSTLMETVRIGEKERHDQLLSNQRAAQMQKVSRVCYEASYKMGMYSHTRDAGTLNQYDDFTVSVERETAKLRNLFDDPQWTDELDTVERAGRDMIVTLKEITIAMETKEKPTESPLTQIMPRLKQASNQMNLSMEKLMKASVQKNESETVNSGGRIDMLVIGGSIFNALFSVLLAFLLHWHLSKSIGKTT